MKTCEEYVLSELEALKKENALLKEQIEELKLKATDSTNDYEERANYYYKVIQKLVEVSQLHKCDLVDGTKILHSYFIWVSNERDKEDYELLEPFAKD